MDVLTVMESSTLLQADFESILRVSIFCAAQVVAETLEAAFDHAVARVNSQRYAALPARSYLSRRLRWDDFPVRCLR